MSEPRSLIQEYSIYALYFAPRGKDRLLYLGDQIGRRHLYFKDSLVGIIGDSGSGKSSLIHGMFPGLELTNDDDRLDMQKIMRVRDMDDDNFSTATTFHIDMRFQTAFTQMHEIVDFVNKALEKRRRVVVEHFDLLFPALGRPADLMVGIGEEIIVVRPTIFGPLPQDVYKIVHTSLKYRRMAHTVEDVTIYLLEHEFGISHRYFFSSDIRGGFLLRFTEKVDLDLELLASRIHDFLEENLPISYKDDEHITIGDIVVPCNGPRLHMRSTSEVTDFKLMREFIYDDKTETYCLVGLLGEKSCEHSDFNSLELHKSPLS